MNDINRSSLIPYLCPIFTGYRQLTHDVLFFFVIILLSFREQLFLLGQMALELSCDREFSKALCASQAADLFNQPSELLCDQIFNSVINNVINCEYMDIYDKTLNMQNDSNSMILMHLNIRFLQKNYDDLYDLVATLSFRPDVICLSESRINQSLKSIQLQGYNFINAKPNKQAGGTAIYFCSKLKFSQIDAFGLAGSESAWVKIWKNDSTKALVIASIYRHPSKDINQFICDFSDCLEKLSNEKKILHSW